MSFWISENPLHLAGVPYSRVRFSFVYATANTQGAKEHKTEAPNSPGRPRIDDMRSAWLLPGQPFWNYTSGFGVYNRPADLKGRICPWPSYCRAHCGRKSPEWLITCLLVGAAMYGSEINPSADEILKAGIKFLCVPQPTPIAKLPLLHPRFERLDNNILPHARALTSYS